MSEHRPAIVAVSGLSSNTGKTTLVCELLEQFARARMLSADAAWEAIKITRGHYRSCGKDPSGCCVSDLLRDEPIIRSGRSANYERGKDTGRFWEAGAANVHWVIVNEEQVAEGINRALAQVASAGVIVEGNSFLEFIEPDFAIMCARAGENKLKTSARRTLARADALYLSTIDQADRVEAIERFTEWQDGLSVDLRTKALPIYTRHDLPELLEAINQAIYRSSVVSY